MLFNPLQVGSLTLPNRILLAPLTRTRADAGHMPNALMRVGGDSDEIAAKSA